MRRRTQRTREIPFSFDSFLDVVANVVGIIIRLILVVWVGARSYDSVKNAALADKSAKVSADLAAIEKITDPMELELVKHRQELERSQARLLEQLRELQDNQEKSKQVEGRLGTLLAQYRGLEQEQAGVEQAAAGQERNYQGAELTLAELRQRREKLSAEIRDVERMPTPKKVLRYRTPVSKPVHSEEFFFECRQGRVTFIDVSSLVADMRQAVEQNVDALRNQWEYTDVTAVVGAFRLRYTIDRQRDFTETLGGGAPDPNGRIIPRLVGWVAEPLASPRGETPGEALAEGSQFRQVVDRLDPQTSVVTFWIYSDSFALYRQLRDYLCDHDVVVAGRPLPEGYPIACSRRGSVSLGQ